jgi:hypothetical protein
METVKRIIEWFGRIDAEDPAEALPNEVVYEIDTFEDAARVAMGLN